MGPGGVVVGEAGVLVMGDREDVAIVGVEVKEVIGGEGVIVVSLSRKSKS